MNLLQKWKTKTKVQSLPAGRYLRKGTFLKTEKGYFYVHSSSDRYRLISERVLESWSPQRVIHTSESEPAVQHLRIAAKMGFRNGSLIWCIAGAKLYFIEGGKRRWVRSPDALAMLGIHGQYKENPIVVSDTELNLHQPGEDFN